MKLDIFLRVPRLRKIINLVMRINLRTMSTIALLTSRLSSTLDDLRSRCLRQLDTLRAHPLHLLNFILEHRMRDLDDWVEDLWAYVGGLERRTGISNDWSGLERGGKESKLQGAEYAGLLQDLHTVSVELRLALATMKFAGDLGEGFKQLSRRLDETRKEASGEHMKKRVKVALEDQIEYNEVVVKTTRAKLGELVCMRPYACQHVLVSRVQAGMLSATPSLFRSRYMLICAAMLIARSGAGADKRGMFFSNSTPASENPICAIRTVTDDHLRRPTA